MLRHLWRLSVKDDGGEEVTEGVLKAKRPFEKLPCEEL